MENQTRKYYRTANDKKIAGVCGGLGRYFSIRPDFFPSPFRRAATMCRRRITDVPAIVDVHFPAIIFITESSPL